MTMWTIEEFCDATDSWGVRVVKLIRPPPATPSSATPAPVPHWAALDRRDLPDVGRQPAEAL
jgi:hypothetical protein